MKRIALLLVFCSLLSLLSCSYKIDAKDTVREFCSLYPIDTMVYSSFAKSYEDGYIDSEMLFTLYGTDDLPTEKFALALYGKVDTVREIGVFIIENGNDTIMLTELIRKRIDFLSSSVDGEGFIKKYKGALVYAFVDDADYARRIFDGIIE